MAQQRERVWVSGEFSVPDGTGSTVWALARFLPDGSVVDKLAFPGRRCEYEAGMTIDEVGRKLYVSGLNYTNTQTNLDIGILDLSTFEEQYYPDGLAFTDSEIPGGYNGSAGMAWDPVEKLLWVCSLSDYNGPTRAYGCDPALLGTPNPFVKSWVLTDYWTKDTPPGGDVLAVAGTIYLSENDGPRYLAWAAQDGPAPYYSETVYLLDLDTGISHPYLSAAGQPWTWGSLGGLAFDREATSLFGSVLQSGDRQSDALYRG